jgi:hypothetical protein
MKFHPAYQEDHDKPFSGNFSDLKGGEYLGHSAQPELFRSNPGSIIVGIDGEDGAWMSDYYYDPLMKIEGEHWVSSNGHNLWLSIRKPDNA